MHLYKISSIFSDHHVPYLLHVNSARLPRSLMIDNHMWDREGF